MHIFLTGPKHIGKSTVINKIINAIDLEIGGFVTFFDGQGQSFSRKLLMCSPKQVHTESEKNVVVTFHNNRPIPDSCRFDQLGVELLKEAASSVELIIMDECGKLEKDDKLFQRQILEVLNGDIPVLGVIAQGIPSWTVAISEHPRVCLIEVTHHNRNTLPSILIKKLMEK